MTVYEEDEINTIRMTTEEDMSLVRGGGHKLGTIKMSFSDLRTMFGDPTFEGKGDNITTEFVVDYTHFDNYGDWSGGEFTLYDWYYTRDFNDDYTEIEWNIGGKCFDDEMACLTAVRMFKETDIRYAFDRGEPCLSTGEWIKVDLKEVA